MGGRAHSGVFHIPRPVKILSGVPYTGHPFPPAAVWHRSAGSVRHARRCWSAGQGAHKAVIARIPLRERHGECFRKCCRGRWTQRRRTPEAGFSCGHDLSLPLAMVGRHGREPLPPAQRSAADTLAGDAAPGQQVAGQCSRHPTQADQQPGPAHAGQRVPYGGVTGDSSQPCAAPTYSSTARTVSTINSGSASTAPGRHRRIGVTLPPGRRRLIRGYLVTALLTSFGPSYSRSGDAPQRVQNIPAGLVAARVVNELLPGRRVAYAAEELLYLDEFGLRYLLSSLS